MRYFCFLFFVILVAISDPRYTKCLKLTEDGRNRCVIMKTMRPPGYHHHGFVATQTLGHMMRVMYTGHLHCM